MRFMILGSGMQGRACAFDMLKNPAVEEVLLADSSLRNLGEAARWLKSKKVRVARADAADPRRVAQLARGRAVLVSAVPCRFNPPLAKAAVAARVHFVDLGGDTEIVLKELALDAAARKAGVTVLPDVGLGPGMSTTIAQHGIEQLDVAQEVLLRDGGLPQRPAPPMNYLLTFSEHGLLHEYVEDAVALRGGRIVKLPGLSEIETIDLPPPLGRCEAAHAAGGLSTLAHTYAGKIRTMDCKLIRYPGHCAVINAMKAMGFFSTRKLRLGAAALSPRELSARLFRDYFQKPGEKDFVVIHSVVRGLKDGQRAEVVYDMLDRYDERTGMTAMMRSTGFPASIVAQMLASGAISRPGAYPVERGVPTGLFLEEARKRGFNLSWRLRHLDPAPEAAVAA